MFFFFLHEWSFNVELSECNNTKYQYAKNKTKKQLQQQQLNKNTKYKTTTTEKTIKQEDTKANTKYKYKIQNNNEKSR